MRKLFSIVTLTTIIAFTIASCSKEEDSNNNNFNNNNNNNNSNNNVNKCDDQSYCAFGICYTQTGYCSCPHPATGANCDSTIFEKFYREYNLGCNIINFGRPNPVGSDQSYEAYINYNKATIYGSNYPYECEFSKSNTGGIWTTNTSYSVKIFNENTIQVSYFFSTNDPQGTDWNCDSTFVF